jgi:hypothetical protein
LKAVVAALYIQTLNGFFGVGATHWRFAEYVQSQKQTRNYTSSVTDNTESE